MKLNWSWEYMIKLTELAANYIKSKSPTGFRLAVKSSGCNGYRYDWTVAEDGQRDNDVLVEQDGVRLLVDRTSYLYVQDSVIDLEKSSFSSTLKIINPQVKNTCGCGESFSI